MAGPMHRSRDQAPQVSARSAAAKIGESPFVNFQSPRPHYAYWQEVFMILGIAGLVIAFIPEKK